MTRLASNALPAALSATPPAAPAVTLAVAALLSATFACQPRQAPAPTLPDPPSEPLVRPFLWRIDPKPAPTVAERERVAPSYIFGVMHIGVDPYQVLPLGIWKKFDAAGKVVMEVDTTGPETLGLGKQPEGQSLDKQMPPADWAKVVQTLDLDADEAEAIAALKPWMLVVQLTQTLAPKARSIEDVLQARAKEQNKPAAFLESIAVQSALLARFIDPAYLVEFVGNMDAQKRSLAKQAKIYRSGDEEALYRSAITGMEKHIGADGMKALMYDRNRAWVPAIENHVAVGNAFIMVGAAHLVGPDSVIDLLRKRGYTLTRVPE